MVLDIQAALTDTVPDFEDAVVHGAAARNRADYIMTRNVKDFNNAAVPELHRRIFKFIQQITFMIIT